MAAVRNIRARRSNAGRTPGRVRCSAAMIMSGARSAVRFSRPIHYAGVERQPHTSIIRLVKREAEQMTRLICEDYVQGITPQKLQRSMAASGIGANDLISADI